MSRKRVLRLIFLALGLVAVVAVLSTAVILAAPQDPSAGFSIPWWTVDSGGGASQGGSYRLSGSAGQADAGVLAGGVYTLTGGFWNAEELPTPTNTPMPTATNTPIPTATEYSTFLPIIIH